MKSEAWIKASEHGYDDVINGLYNGQIQYCQMTEKEKYDGYVAGVGLAQMEIEANGE